MPSPQIDWWVAYYTGYVRVTGAGPALYRPYEGGVKVLLHT